MRRISVVGVSGVGKTTVAASLAAAMGVPHLELDSVFHQADWQPLPASEFRAAVSAFVAADGWVVDGNYSAVCDLVWQRADTIVWLDLPRRLVMRRVVGRTLARIARGTELWNGNREHWINLFSTDPNQSIILWAWTQHGKVRQRFLRASTDPANARLEFIWLRSAAEVAAFTRRQASPGGVSA